MTLYSYPRCLHSHRARIVLQEKGISSEVDFVSITDSPQELLELNPYGTTPTFVDRDLVLYQADIIMEYLDERFPHPPLYPMDPVSRARSRLLTYRIEQDWYSLYDQILKGDEKQAVKAKKTLRENLIAAMPVFAAKPYFLSDEFTLVDCTVAPLLWRLSSLHIELPKQAEPIRNYAKRIFERDSFQASLSEDERDLAGSGLALTA
ncbi:glutathione S-transferase N-terminal domain-containing protein [Methylogaea oryzae]|uniref:Stringent starvation protein A n=2 Tax=Methylogaea oryzae TaxID=1295382 RepID=A0A8D4VP35_9GAMM|nr:glutathione S-transferase N-terminal domain-containing protein [Methylogaea oryzae]BBL71181.1 stringent starvation protein A [Methylogaea oryzae]